MLVRRQLIVGKSYLAEKLGLPEGVDIVSLVSDDLGLFVRVMVAAEESDAPWEPDSDNWDYVDGSEPRILPREYFNERVGSTEG